jgi:capsule polysaccharide export protein KpsE/RkpR
MLGALADTTFEVRSGGGPLRISLADLLHAKGNTPERRRESVIRKLGSRVSAIAVLKTGVVRVRVTAPGSDIAQAMVQFILDGVNRFNLVTRQSGAGAERRFMEGRLEDARIELREAEDRLKAFLQHNREYRNSPELSFQQDRLSRDVQMQQQLYTSLAQGYEQAKIEEIRDTPVITIVERPETPAWPDSRHIVSSVIVAMIAGGLCGVLIGFVLSAIYRERTSNGRDMTVFDEEVHAALADLRRPWRLLSPTTKGKQ